MDQVRADERGHNDQSPIKQDQEQNGANNPAGHEDDRRVLCIVNQKCRGNRAGQFAAGEEAKHCDRNFLKEQCEQSPDQAKDERDD